jgi:hypothetical protein
MQPVDWRIQHLNPVGVLQNIIEDPAPVAQFNSLRSRGDGSCEEGSITALVSSLGIQSRDIVVVEVSEDQTNYVPIYSGVVTAPGSKRSTELSQIGMVGLSKRLTEVAVDEQVYAEQDLGTMVRLIASEFLPAGVIYDVSQVPVVNFTVGELRTQYQLLADVLDQLALTAPGFVVPASQTYTYDGVTYSEFETVPPISWGVTADRKFFFKRVRGSQTLNETSDDIDVEYETPSSEDICTKVIFYVLDGIAFSGAIEISNPALVSEFGEAVKVFTTVGDQIILQEVNEINKTGAVTLNNLTITAEVFEASFDGGMSWFNIAGAPPVTGATAALVSDQDPLTAIRYRLRVNKINTSLVGSFNLGNVLFDIKWPTAILIKDAYVKASLFFGAIGSPTTPAPGFFTLRNSLQNTDTLPTVVIDSSGIVDGRFPDPFDPNFLNVSEWNFRADSFQFRAPSFSVTLVPPSNTAELIFTLERIEADARTKPIEPLTLIAESTFKAPVFERVDVRSVGILAPAPIGTVNFEVGGSVTLDIADVDYRIAPGIGFQTTFNLGQGVKADLIAQAALIKRQAKGAELGVFDIVTRPTP